MAKETRGLQLPAKSSEELRKYSQNRHCIQDNCLLITVILEHGKSTRSCVEYTYEVSEYEYAFLLVPLAIGSLPRLHYL